MLNVYVTYHNNAVVITRNNAKENGHLPYYGSLLSTALQCMQSSNPLGFNNINNSNNRKSNYAGDKAYFKDKKRNGDADKEPKAGTEAPAREDSKPNKVESTKTEEAAEKKE
uniref:Uncharacterized protein n=1 Tax=Ditylenchus dipsaci TaxID=166011 RepID=A0A915D7N6_9BILA